MNLILTTLMTAPSTMGQLGLNWRPLINSMMNKMVYEYQTVRTRGKRCNEFYIWQAVAVKLWIVKYHVQGFPNNGSPLMNVDITGALFTFSWCILIMKSQGEECASSICVHCRTLINCAQGFPFENKQALHRGVFINLCLHIVNLFPIVPSIRTLIISEIIKF